MAAVAENDSLGENSSTIAKTYTPYRKLSICYSNKIIYYNCLAFGSVRNYVLTLVEKTLNATWDPPQNAAACVSKYVIQVWNQNNNAADYETEETYYEFSPVVGCMTYNVQVKPWVNQSMEGSTSLNDLTIGDLRKLNS